MNTYGGFLSNSFQNVSDVQGGKANRWSRLHSDNLELRLGCRIHHVGMSLQAQELSTTLDAVGASSQYMHNLGLFHKANTQRRQPQVSHCRA